MSARLASAASCRGVRRALFRALTRPPRSNNILAHYMEPTRAAQ